MAKTRAILRALTIAGVQVDLTATIGVNQERALHVLLHGKDPVGTAIRPLNAVTQGTGATLLISGESSNLQQDPGNFALEVVLKTAGALGVGIDPRDRNWVLNVFTDSVQVGDQGVLLAQRGATNELFTALRAAGVELVAQSDNADAIAVETAANILKVASRLYGFNGSTWDRVRVGFQTDGMAPVPFGAMQTASVIQGWNGTAHDRYRAVFDNQANPATGKMPTLPARANAANPAWTEGNVVPASTDLAGRIRTLPTPFLRSDGVAAFPSWRLAAPVTAPAAGGALVTVAAVADQINRVFGVMAHQESETIDNLVELREGATVRTAFGVVGTSGQIISPVPILVPAANTAVSLNSRNAPGAGIDVVGALLVETA